MLKRWIFGVALLPLLATRVAVAEPAEPTKAHAADKAPGDKASDGKSPAAKPVAAPAGAEKPVAEKTSDKSKDGADAKAGAKPGDKSDPKSAGKPGDKPVVEKKSAEAKEGQNVDRLAAKLAKDAANANKAKKAVGPTINAPNDSVDEPEVQPPPLKVTALKDEMKRHAAAAEHPGPKGDRESLAKMAADVNHAREALREDTARMEALLASQDSGAAGGGEGEGGKKTPSPLDVVAKAMRGMKPEQAAPVVSHMERKLAADVLRRMPAADAGKVMGFLKPELAAELATEMASAHVPPGEKKR